MLQISIDKKRIVEAIQDGLNQARNEIYASGTLTNNRIHMQKWDYIGTSLKKSFSDDENLVFVPLDRGLFEPVMIFDKKSKVLFTIMKEQNFQKLTDRKSVAKSHYIDALLDYNYGYQTEPLQMNMFEGQDFFSANAEFQIKDLKLTIESLLDVDNISCYVTIVVDFTGFSLTDVRAVLCSKWLNTIDSESWGEFIIPSYEDSASTENGEYVQTSSVKDKIFIKPKAKKEHV